MNDPICRAGLLATALLGMVCSGSIAAEQASLPGIDVIRAIYQAHQPWSEPKKNIDFSNEKELSPYFDKSFIALLRREVDCEKKTREICALDWDWIYNAQDGEPEDSHVDIKACSLEPHLQYCVSTPRSNMRIRYSMTQTPAGWRVSDVEDYNEDKGQWLSIKKVLSTYEFYPKPSSAFDSPLETKRVDLGPWNPSDQDCDRQLSCFYFDHFMVKQLGDSVGKGCGADAEYARECSLVPIPSGSQRPACVEQKAGQEIFLTKPEQHIIFLGVKSKYIFIDGEGSQQGYYRLDVFDANTGLKTFDDVLADNSTDRPIDAIQSIEVHGTELTLTYKRNHHTVCSKGEKACLTRIADELGIEDSRMASACSHAGRNINEPDIEIGYNVKAVYNGTTLVAKPVGGVIDCWEDR